MGNSGTRTGIAAMVLACCLARGAHAADVVGLNRVPLREDAAASFRILVAGHLYGDPRGTSLETAKTFLAARRTLQALRPDLVVLLGDVVRSAGDEAFSGFERDVLGTFDVPVLNAVGNHDVTDRALYEHRYGRTFFAFRHGPSVFLVLDTEREGGSIDAEQVSVLQTALEEAADETVRQVFVFMHKLLFAIGEPRYQAIAARINGWPSYPPETPFQRVVAERLAPLAQHKPVFVIAGDIGAPWSLPLLYDKAEGSRLVFMATGIGDVRQDAVLVMDISASSVSFQPVSLTGERLEPLERYTPEFWRRHFWWRRWQERFVARWDRLMGHRPSGRGGRAPCELCGRLA